VRVVEIFDVLDALTFEHARDGLGGVLHAHVAVVHLIGAHAQLAFRVEALQAVDDVLDRDLPVVDLGRVYGLLQELLKINLGREGVAGAPGQRGSGRRHQSPSVINFTVRLCAV
jgi:hypothetical protein